MENQKEEKQTWIVCSNDSNDGCGGWDYQQPELVTDEVCKNILWDRSGNSLADIDCFETESEAQAYYKRMTA